MPPKLKELLAKLTDSLKPDPAARDEKQVAACLTAMADYAETDEAKGYEPVGELKTMVDQIRKDLDAQTEATRKLDRMGLAVHDHSIKVMGYKEIMDLRRVGRIFRTKEDAEGFAALAARSIWGKHPAYAEVVSSTARGMADELTKDLDPGVAGSGAELVANIYMADLIANVEAVGVLFPLCDRVPLATTGQTIWPKLTGELTAYPAAVAAKLTESAPTFGTVTMTPVKWGTLTPVPNEFFRNPTLLAPLGQRLAWMSTRAISYAFDNALVNGDGTADYGTITGLLQDASLSAVTAGAATTIATYTGAEIGAVIAGVSVDYVTDPYWLMHLSSERTLRNIRSTTGTPLYERGNNGEPNTIDNYPYKTCQRFTAAGSVGAAAKWAAFGDLRLSHFFGMLGAIEFAQSEHARFEYDMTVVRGLAHADAALKDANSTVIAKTHA